MLLRVKQLFWIIFILFDLCVLAAILGGVYYLESDGPRHELESFLGEKLGREVVFEKNLDLIFYPWLGLETGPVSIAAAPGADYEHQLSVRSIDFKVRLLPLLHGELEVDTIVVDSPVFRMDRGRDGKLDFPAMGRVENATSEDSDGLFFRSITVRGIVVSNATCTYTDVATGNFFNVSGINIRTGLLRKDTPLAFDVGAMLETDLFNLRAKAEFKGLLDFSRSERTISLSETTLALIAESDELLGSGESVQAITNLDFNLVDGKVDLRGIVVQAAGVLLSGEATCGNIYHAPEFRGSLRSTRFDPKSVFSRFTPEPIPSKFKDILNSASFSVDFDSNLERTILKNMVLKVDDTTVQGDFSLKDYSSPWVEFNVYADKIVLDPYARIFKRSKSAGSAKSRKNGSGTPPAQDGKLRRELRETVIADLVHRIPCRGRLEVGYLAYDGMRLETTRLAISPGPKVAGLSIGKGSYLDGDFSLRADLTFDGSRKKDTLYLSGAGEVSPFTLSRIPVRSDVIKFRSGKAGLKLKNMSSHGKTLVELFRNLRFRMELRADGAAASLGNKDIPREYRHFHVKELKLDIDGTPLPTVPPEGMVGRRLEIALSAGLLKPDLKLAGSFSGDILCERFHPDMAALRNSTLDLSVEGSGLPVVKKGVKLALSGGGKLRNHDLKLNRFSIKSGAVDVHGDLDAKRLGTETAFATGRLKLGNTDCSEIFDLFGIAKPKTQDPDAFDSVELDTIFQLNGENLNLRVNRCRLDNATAAGTFELVDFNNPSINFIVTGDNVDVDRFLPPEEDEKDKAQSGNEFEVKLPEWEFPDSFLGAINASGKVECNYFRIFDFGGSRISADVDMQKSVIDIHNIKADFHKGNLAGKLALGLRNGTVSLDSDFEGRGFEAGLFFADYIGRDCVNGKTDASLKLKGSSSANTYFTNSMTGSLAFKITNGSYLFESMAAKEKRAGKPATPTAFSLMQGTVRGSKGDFKVEDYLLKTNYLTATANGGFSFPKDSINLRVDADIVKLPNLYLKIVNALLDALTGVNVTVTGRLSDPRVQVKGLERWTDVLNDVLGLPEQSFMFFKDLIF
ncbi:AsmA family protein [Maridesulfovibrio sp.]|uniref:AsmA family protein n=1 Tax=Maridesulfovibrio sp. TaxID=2795000 RepID=UPI002A187163|nr:AsmA family protein [Maridesulfovibrio sp.]